MASTYGEGKTFLDTLKRSFTDVPVNKEKDDAISTTEFLEAAESLTTLFGKLTCVQILKIGRSIGIFQGQKGSPEFYVSWEVDI
jgi:hypothetical protein